MECDYPKLVIHILDLLAQESILAQKLGPNWIRIPVNIDSKIELNHKVRDRGHIHNQVQFS